MEISEIVDRDSLERWLEDQPKEWAQAIAARAALRVAPNAWLAAVQSELQLSDDDRQRIILATFRANFLSWAARNYPADNMRSAAAAAADATTAIATAYPSAHTAADAAATAAVYAAAAGNNAAADAAAVAAMYAARAATASNAAVNSVIWMSIRADLQFLEEKPSSEAFADGRSPGMSKRALQVRELMGKPLWMTYGSNRKLMTYQPDRRLLKDISEFEASEFAQETSFGLIADWYHSVFAGESAFGIDAEIAIAQMSPKDWGDGDDPRDCIAVMDRVAEIAGWGRGDDGVAGDGGQGDDTADLDANIEDAIENAQLQVPAAYRFRWDNERIVARSPENETADSEFAADLLGELKRKSATLLEALRQKNADQRVVQSIKGLLEILPETIDTLRPGLLRSHTRSLEADAAAYNDPKDELELFPGAVAAILDVSETARDLQGCYPQLRDIEVEIAALGIEPEQVTAVSDNLDRITEAVSTQEDIVDPAALDALYRMRGVADKEAPLKVKQKRVAEYGLVVRNYLSTLARVALDNAFTRATANLSTDVWKKARPKVVDGISDGIGAMAKPTTVVGIAYVVGLVLGPVAGIAAAAAGFGKIDRLMQIAEKWLKKQSGQQTENDSKKDADEDAAE